MKFLAILMTLIGAALLLLSLTPTNRICQKSSQFGWRVLGALILFFILGYVGFITYLVINASFLLIYLAVATILFGGAVFALMVTRLSLRSYVKLEKVALRAKHNALHDSLTGLPNRQCFLNTLFQNVNQSQAFTLLSIDLNNFKQVNDALGHYHGDQLLVSVVRAIEKRLAGLCTLFRMGGDEFTLILEADSGLELDEVAKRIHQALDEPFQIMGYAIDAGVSVGATNFPEHSSNIDLLLQQADLAMYASKATKERYVLYTAALNKDATKQLEITSRLKQALSSNEFELYFQPIVAADSELIHGAEVLLRWPQTDGSFIAPDLFIPTAEQSGLIGQITSWVVEQAVANLASLNKHGFTGTLHINLSARDLLNDSLYLLLKRLLREERSLSKRLVFEITESAMMTDLASVKRMMLKFADEGFTFSLDDFGTGFSSLSLLRELPIKQIKIDRSFVNDMTKDHTDHAIVKSSIYLAKNLDCSVVAEGVENSLVERALMTLSCDYLQGYYYSKPMTLEQFIQHTCFKTTR